MALELIDVNKTIKNKQILSGITMKLEPGKIYAVVGRNGSGKTMLLRAISGLIRLDSGKIMFDELTLHHDVDVFPSLGLTLENAGLYSEFTGQKNLELLAGIKKKASKDDIATAISRVGLDPNDKRTVRKYSLGMKQRIVLAQAIMEKPEILLLDEPTNSLDEEGVELIRGVIAEERDRGAVILIATHNKDDIAVLVDHIFHIDAGKITKEGII